MPHTATAGNRAQRRAKARKEANQQKKLPLFTLGIIGIIMLFVIAAIMTRSADTGSSDGLSQTAPVSITGSLDLFPESGEDPAIGATMPEVTGQTFAGDKVSITRDGRAKIVLLLAHWCQYCQAEVPKVQSWLKDVGAPEGVDLYAVATATNANQPNYPPSTWLEREGFTVETMADDARSSVGKAFGLSGYPFWVFVSAEGEVVGRRSGALSIEEIETVLTGLR